MVEEIAPTWEEVARRHGRKIYNFAYRLAGNPDDAADLVQEVLLRVRRSAHVRAHAPRIHSVHPYTVVRQFAGRQYSKENLARLGVLG